MPRDFKYFFSFSKLRKTAAISYHGPLSPATALLILAAVSSMLVYGLVAGTLGAVLPALSRQLQLTPRQMGRLALAQAIGLILASFAFGPLTSLTGKKTASLAALATIACGQFLLPRAANAFRLAVILFVIDCGGGILVESANAFTYEMGTAFSEMTKSNLLNAAFGLGGVLTALLAANVYHGDTRRLLRFLLTVSLAAFACNLLNPFPGPAAVGPITANAAALATSPLFWIISALFFFSVAAEVGVWTWLTPHLIARGISERKALNTLSIGFALGMMLGRLAVVPLLPASLSPTQVTLAAALLMIVTTWLTTGVRTARAATLIVFAAGVAMAPVFPNCIAITNTAFPNNTTALGLALVSGWLGMAISSPLIGALAHGDTTRLSRALLVLPAASVLLFVFTLALPNGPR